MPDTAIHQIPKQGKFRRALAAVGAWLQGLWCKHFEVEPSRRREVALDHAARTAFQILGAVLPLAQSTEFELTLADPMHEFDAGDRRCGLAEMLEAEHRTEPKLDGSMILFDQIVIWHV